MGNYYIIIKNGKIHETVPILSPNIVDEYVCWCENISGTCPKVMEPFSDQRTPIEKRRCEYIMIFDPLKNQYYGEMLDGDYSEEEMKTKLRIEKQKIKDKFPKTV